MKKYTDLYFMHEAVKEACKAMDCREIPVGAVVVSCDRIIARAHNQVEQLVDVTAHAEILAITSASNFLGSKYLTECTLYVTLEPCLMCAGALHWVQLGKLVFGANDPRYGYSLIQTPVLHAQTKVKQGVCREESEALLHDFFKRLRD